MESFTARELDVWRLTAAGLTLLQIGRRLGIGKATVAGVRKTLYGKVRAHNAVKLTLAAIAHGVIPIPEVKPSPVVLPKGHRPPAKSGVK